MQQELKDLGYYTGKIDGDDGFLTMLALYHADRMSLTAPKKTHTFNHPGWFWTSEISRLAVITNNDLHPDDHPFDTDSIDPYESTRFVRHCLDMGMDEFTEFEPTKPCYGAIAVRGNCQAIARRQNGDQYDVMVYANERVHRQLWTVDSFLWPVGGKLGKQYFSIG